MDIEEAKKRIEELEMLQEQSALSHHQIVGRLAEAKLFLQKLEEEKEKLES